MNLASTATRGYPYATGLRIAQMRTATHPPRVLNPRPLN